MTEVVRFEADVVIEKTMIERDYRSVYGPTSLNVVRSDVDEELKQLPEFATKPVLKLITFFEKRRVLKIGWLVVIIAAIIGGISGAAISHLPATSRFFRSTKGIQTSQENTKIASPSLPSPSRSSLGPSEPSIANPTPVLRLELPRPQTSPTPGP